MRLARLFVMTGMGLWGFAGLVQAQTYSLGVAKDVQRTGRDLVFDVYIENLGDQDLNTISCVDDLDAAFGAGNYSVTSGPSIISGPLSSNSGFDGSTDTELLDGTGVIAGGQVTHIQFAVTVTSVTDQGNGLGIYTNQVYVNDGENHDDYSDWGVDPDPNGNGNPGDVDEDDPTLIDISEAPMIGAAKAAALAGTQITLDVYVENLGNRTLSSISAPDNLNAVFGAGNYVISSAPTLLQDPGSLTLNAGFDGSSETDLVGSGSLEPGALAQIRFVVDVTNVTDQGLGYGVYRNQIEVSGVSPGMTQVTDLSDNGSDPDPDGNGNPTQPGENDPTPMVVGEEAYIGVAKTAAVSGSVVTFTYYLENLGNVTVTNLSMVEDLNAVFDPTNFFVNLNPVLLDDPGTVQLNGDYDGFDETEMLGSASLAAGDTAAIQMAVTVVALADMGSGLGNYSNQVNLVGQAPSGAAVSDLSDDGTDPDPNGNGDARDDGENDATAFSVASIARIGIAKEAVITGIGGGAATVSLFFTLTNYGNRTISSLTVMDDLNAVYGAGNFSHLQDPTLVTGSPTLTYNASYNGNTNTSMLTSGSLAPGETVIFMTAATVTNITDQGFGLGIFQNQVTVNGLDPSANPVFDVSHEGDDPDPNGDGIPDEQDPTVIDVNGMATVGIAKDVSVSGNQVTIDFYLENLGTVNVGQLAFLDDLDLVFGAGNYWISTSPFFLDDPGTLTLNGGYSGSPGNADVLDVTQSYLTVGDTAQIQMVVDVTNVTNSQGLGVGQYANQVAVTGFGTNGAPASDLSDSGVDPDPNGDSNPSEAGENDPSTFTLAVDTPIGVALYASVAGHVITVDWYLENLGASTLTAVSLTQSLDEAFGAGNYTINAMPAFISDPGTLVLNGAFDGSGDADVLDSASSTLASGVTAQIQMTVEVTRESDQGLGYGIYSLQSTAQGTQPNMILVSDLSDDGTDPDPNGNNDPSEAGEEDPTVVTIVGDPSVGLAIKAFVNGTQVTLDFFVENLGTSTLTNFLIDLPLNPIFGSGNYSIQTQPHRVSGASTLTLSPQFFGFNVFARVVAGGSLAPGEMEHLRTVINVNTVTDQGNGFGIYHLQTTVDATDPGGNPVSDTSDDGYVTDPNGNGDAGDAGENDLNVITIGDEANLGVAKNVSVVGSEVTFDFYLENFGGSNLDSLSLVEDLDAVFGAGNYSLAAGSPSLIDDPGTLNLNASYDGSSDTQLMDAADTLPATDTAQIRLVVNVTTIVDQGLGLGNYTNQVMFEGDSPLGAHAQDLSDFGTDPDPGGNGFANDEGEGDPTTFSVAQARIGVAKHVSMNGREVTFDYYVENLGQEALTNVSLHEDFDAIFGAGNYLITSAPDIVTPPREFVLNTGFDGSSDTQLIASGGMQLGVLEQIQVTVSVNELIDQGSGLGVCSNQVTVTADGGLSDLSDDGTDPDPDGDGDPDEAGENDPTTFTVVQEPIIGVAKTASVSTRTVTFDLHLESFANTELLALSLTEDLNAVFGAGNYSITAPPSLIVDPGTLNLNAGYDGGADPEILAAGSTLAIGDVAQIRLAVEVLSVTDQGLGLGTFENQASVSADSPNGNPGSDYSDDGTNPDPDGDGHPNETGENDPTPFTLGASLGDFVWNDLNGDGVQDAGEPGLDGVTLFLDLNTNGNLDGGEPTETTAGGGAYDFLDLAAGSYQVRVEASSVPTGFVAITTTVADVTLFAGEDENDADFGYQQQDAVIGDRVWEDFNGDGIQDAGEPGIANVTVDLIDTSGPTVVDTQTTDASGNYGFQDLPTGAYQVTVTDLNGVLTDYQLTGGTDPHVVNLAVGEVYPDADFGYCWPVRIVDYSTGNQICAGTSQTFFVDVVGSPTIQYQWYFNGTLIPGAEQNSYTIVVPLVGNSGNYFCRVSNGCGTEDSVVMLLDVLPLDVDLQPDSRVQGVLPVEFLATLFCDNPPITFEWEILTTGEVFITQDNPFVFDDILDASDGDLEFQVSVWDALDGPVTDVSWILIAVDPVFFDLNGDGCNTVDDLQLLYDSWLLEVNDPNGDGVVDIRDFLYINISGDCETL